MKFLRLSWHVAAVAALGICRPVAADFLPIYGGPTYDSASGNGYQSGFATGFALKGAGLATIPKYAGGINKGTRSVRWDTSGTVSEFQALGLSDGYTHSEIYGANPSGMSVGLIEKYTGADFLGYRAVRWTPSGAISELGTLGTSSDGITSAAAQAVNASGVAAGYSRKYVSGAVTGVFAARWDASGAVTELGNLGVGGPASADSIAYDINDAGAAVGSSHKFVGGVDKGYRAVRWDAGATVATELGTLGTDPSGYASFSNKALAINNAGVAVGLSVKYVNGVDTGGRAVCWAAGSTAVTELGNLGINPTGFTSNVAVDINEAGTIIGNVEKYVGSSFRGNRAVRWNAGGTAITELGNLGTNALGNTVTFAADINASGLITGYALKFTGTDSDEEAVLWGANGAAIDLTTLIDPASGWIRLRHAWGIDDNNWVTGEGLFDPDGSGPLQQYHRYFIMQVPEPSALMLIGSVAFALQTRMRKRRQGGS